VTRSALEVLGDSVDSPSHYWEAVYPSSSRSECAERERGTRKDEELEEG